jgi:heat shock protein HslJ
MPLIVPLHVAVLLGCSSTVLARQASQDAATNLAGTSWELVRFQGGDEKILAPDEKSKYTIAFDHGGNISARIDCNRGRGTWKSPGPNQIEFGPLALTRAMCPPAPLNDRIVRDWAHVRSFIIKDGHLLLSLMADSGTYEFEPLGAASGASETAISNLPASFVGISHAQTARGFATR